MCQASYIFRISTYIMFIYYYDQKTKLSNIIQILCFWTRNISLAIVTIYSSVSGTLF